MTMSEEYEYYIDPSAAVGTRSRRAKNYSVKFVTVDAMEASGEYDKDFIDYMRKYEIGAIVEKP